MKTKRIFANHPDKLRIIPVISRFIENVEKFTATESTAKCHQKASASKEKSTKRKKQSENSPSPPSSEIIDKQLQKICNWIKTHMNFKKNIEILKGSSTDNDFSINGTFSLVPIISQEGMRFTCQVCKTEVVLQMTPLGSIMLSNVHRHISQSCLLQDNLLELKVQRIMIL